ncbi:uncharacterized protein LOC113851198 [Abrus precatorius]|uniref:Uncharacterized protein LOC113851198 n=1 Tax=Abrus precatorius TaxID=3816 RepID=A0A8B8K362_ABRPR|nr:uncharacterized protein LOC113851198 [Abrus precatorius]
MKVSISSRASSPSSSSTNNLDPTMCNSKSTTSGCLTAILRKILCSDGLPRDPSDQKTEFDSLDALVSSKDHHLEAKHSVEGAATTTITTTPGIVARLMGLESIEIPCVPKPSSLSRSRSMNSVDYLGECNGMEGHKKVKSTLSFREAPTFLLHENDNFLVFNFENGGQSREFKSNGRKRETGCAELKQKVLKERGELRENKSEKVNDEKGKHSKKRVSPKPCRNDGKLQEITNSSHPLKALNEKQKCFDSEAVKLSHIINRKEVVVGEKQKRKKRRKKKTICHPENKIEIECKSEDSSPVSVLDFEREPCGTVGLNSRRKLSPELENDQHFLQRSDGNLMIDERKVKAIENNKYEGSKKIAKHSHEYIGVWGEACGIVENELGASNHAWTNKQGDLDEISADFGSEIFDHLLNEVVEQLVCSH